MHSFTAKIFRRCALTAIVIASAAFAADTGGPAPAFTLTALSGGQTALSQYKGQVVLVNFWARWAGDSRQEMPALERINTTYRRAGLVVLGVSLDEDRRRAGEFAGAMKLSYPILFDIDLRIGRDYSIQKMPMTILVDRAGVVRYAHVGFKSADEGAYLDHIRELLRE